MLDTWIGFKAFKIVRGPSGRDITVDLDESQTEAEVLDYVKQWKLRRRPALNDSEVALAIRRLNVLGWIDALPSDNLPLPEEALIA